MSRRRWLSALTALSVCGLLWCVSCSAEPPQPVEEFVRGVVYTAKRVWERWLEQVRTPRLRMTPVEGGGLAFQLDPANPDARAGPNESPPAPFLGKCPLCRALPADSDQALMTGSWSVVLWSRNFLLTTVSDLDRELDRLEAGRPSSASASAPRTLAEWLADPPNVRCAQLVILDDKFEFAYHVVVDSRSGGGGGRSKSVVGPWERLGSGGFVWHLVPGFIRLQLCIAYYHRVGLQDSANTSRASPSLSPSSAVEFMVLNQVQEGGSGLLLPCENFIVLAKRDDSLAVGTIRDFLDSRRNTFEGLPFNRLERLHCNRSN